MLETVIKPWRERHCCCLPSGRQHTNLDVTTRPSLSPDLCIVEISILPRVRCLSIFRGMHSFRYVCKMRGRFNNTLYMCCLCSRVKKNISRNQVSIALFLSSNIHQGDEIFSVQSRGIQCAFMTHEFVAKPKLQVLIDRLVNNQSGIKFITWCSPDWKVCKLRTRDQYFPKFCASHF